VAAEKYGKMADSKAARLLYAEYKGRGYQSADVIRRMLPVARWALEEKRAKMGWGEPDFKDREPWEPPEDWDPSD
jgi:hypothetical protein